MRRSIAFIAALPILTLAACGGTGPQTVGSVAPPAPVAGSGGTGGTGATGGTPTPTPSGGSGAGISVSTPTPTPSAGATTLLSVTTATTFDAVGAFHSLNQDKATNAELYQGHASTTGTPSGTITYDPRDGYFTVAISDSTAGVSHTYTFQDPAHRYDASTKPADVPTINGFNYLVLNDANSPSTFFYQRPGASTNYVTLAGFVRTVDSTTASLRERGVMVFGQRSAGSQVPITGAGHYSGGFLASSVLNTGQSSSYLQWIAGSSDINVDFARGALTLDVAGTITQTFQDGALVPDASLPYATGTAFKASGSATFDALRSGTFSGQFSSASLGGQAIDFARVSADKSTAGASSIDGAFYGPQAVNVGGNMRIIGGVPNQRVDIQGAFTGAVIPGK